MGRLLLLSCGFLLVTHGALAQPGNTDLARARVMFEEGRAAYEAGDYELALERFRGAHELTDSPDILYNVATCADRLRLDPIALEAYLGYLAGRPDSADRAAVEARIEVIRAQIRREEAEREQAALDAVQREAEGRRLEEEQRALRERLAARPTVTPDPGPAPWIVMSAGLGVAVAGAIMVIVAEVEAQCVMSPRDCVADPANPMWSEVEGAYETVPILQGVGYASIGVGVAAALVGVVWGVALGGGGDDEPVEVGFGPGSFTLRGRF